MQLTAMIVNFIYSILGGILTLLFMYFGYKWFDKMNFTFASYNAGFRTIVKAQNLCKKQGLNENLWQNIKRIAPRVRAWRHEETLGYVEKINTMME
jgi:hypothetical protein